jgi:hypothetical protein
MPGLPQAQSQVSRARRAADPPGAPFSHYRCTFIITTQMHRTFLFAALLLAPLALTAQPFPMLEVDRWGYIDAEGSWVIEPAYAWATPFTEGLAAVTEDGPCWQMITPSGEPAFEEPVCGDGWPQWTETGQIVPMQAVGPLSEGVMTFASRNRVSFLDASGARPFEGEFREAFPFTDGRARIATAERTYGFIDASGGMVIEPRFGYARDFSDGLAAARPADSEQWGAIDPAGEWAIEPQFYELREFSEGLAAFRPPVESGLPFYGYIDASGAVVIEPQFERAEPFSEELAAVRLDGRFGFVDASGVMAIPAQYRRAESFSEGRAAVRGDEGWHYIDASGARAFDHPLLAQAIHLEPFRGGLARAVFSLDGSSSYMSFGTEPYHAFDNAFYGYFDRDGRLVAVQSDEARAELLSRVAAAEDEAELARLAEEEYQMMEQERILSDCPTEIVYGNPAHADVLEVEIEGMVRRLHFERISVEDVGRGRYRVVVPRITTEPAGASGWTNAHPAFDNAPRSMGMGSGRSSLVLTLEPEATFASSRISREEMVMPSLDCLFELPGFSFGDLVDGWKSEAITSIEPGADGHWLRLVSTNRESGAELRLNVASPPSAPAGASGAAAALLTDGAVEARAFLDPALHALYLHPQASADDGGRVTVRYPQQIPLPRSGTRVARESRNALDVYHFEVIADDHLVVEHHTLRLEDESAARPLIERPRGSLSQPLDQLELGDDTRRDRFVVTSLTREALPPLAARAADAPARRAAPLAIADLPLDAAAPALVRPIAAHEVLFGMRGAIARMALRDTTVDGRAALALTLEPEESSELLADALEGALVAQYGAAGAEALLALIGQGQERAMAWEREGQREEFITWIRPILTDLDVPVDGLDALHEPEAVFEMLFPVIDESSVRAAEVVIVSRQQGAAEQHRQTLTALMNTLGQGDDSALDRAEVARHLTALGIEPPDHADPSAYGDAVMRRVSAQFGDAFLRMTYDEMFGGPQDHLTVLLDPITGTPLARVALHHAAARSSRPTSGWRTPAPPAGWRPATASRAPTRSTSPSPLAHSTRTSSSRPSHTSTSPPSTSSSCWTPRRPGASRTPAARARRRRRTSRSNPRACWWRQRGRRLSTLAARLSTRGAWPSASPVRRRRPSTASWRATSR